MTDADDCLIQIALERGLLRPEDLEEARRKIAGNPFIAGAEPGTSRFHDVRGGEGTHRPTLVDVLVANGVVDEPALTRAVAEEFGMPCVLLADRAIDPSVLATIPREFVQAHGVIPFQVENGLLHVAVADPLAMDVIDDLARQGGPGVIVALASRGDLSRALVRHYGSDTEGPDDLLRDDRALAEQDAVTATPIVGQEGEVSERDAPINQLVQSIIADAVQRRASDIHLEPLERSFRVRYRVDGVLQVVDGPPKRLQLAVISRLKIMANISIAEKRVPQDGRIQVTVAGRTLDLRVSSLPTAHGESIVMRILDAEGLKLGLPELGFLPDDQREFEQLIASPDGIVLVTGPTGSGKTTTLYACLHQLNQSSRKIITVEEPVEYQLSGINQVPVNAAVGMTFAAALRAMLRQAPNIVMVGEIRDRETADIAINASLTGHLVFSTLHTNDAPSAVTRLIDIGAKPFLVAAALKASMAQRLVRRNCPQCRRSYAPSVRELHSLGVGPAGLTGARFARGAGCAACHGTGYQGRLGIFEIFLVNDTIRTLIYDRAPASRLRQQARLDGLRSMREDGLRKVLAGDTTIEEVVAATVGDEL